MRNLSSRFLEALFAQETDEVLLACVELYRPSWAQPIRLVNNSENVFHAGQTYTAFPFTILLPSDDEEETSPLMQFVLANASTELMDEVRISTDPIEAVVHFVLADTPDVLELEFEASIFNLNSDDETIRGAMTIEPILERSFSRLSFTPENNPGLFP